MTRFPRIEAEFLLAKNTPTDINEHIQRLYELALECPHIVEGGVRYVVSTWAFMLGCACRGGEFHSYCWGHNDWIKRAQALCADEGGTWHYHDGNWLTVEIPPTDLLFIDTNHFYWQLKQELQQHGVKARKYIVCHDTTAFADEGQDGSKPGLWQAIEEFLAEGHWRIKERWTHNHGLTVLERIA